MSLDTKPGPGGKAHVERAGEGEESLSCGGARQNKPLKEKWKWRSYIIAGLGKKWKSGIS